jgi:tight adherence protein B
MQALPLSSLVAVFAGFLVVVLLILRAIPDNSTMNRRLKRVSQKAADSVGKHAGGSGKSKVSLVDRKSQTQKGDFLFRTLGSDTSALKAQIRRAGLSLSLFELFIIYTLAALLMATVGTYGAQLAAVKAPLLYTVPAGTLVGYLLVRFWLNKLCERRVSTFNDHFPDALELMVRCLRTGIPITEMFQQVSTNSFPPVSTEFKRVYNDIRFGIPLGEAIWRTAERMPTQEYIFFAISVSIQSETGGNLAENLEKLAGILRNRLQVKRLVKTKSAEARLTAKLLTAMPILFSGALYFLSPSDFVRHGGHRDLYHQ